MRFIECDRCKFKEILQIDFELGRYMKPQNWIEAIDKDLCPKCAKLWIEHLKKF
jgi:hypothetical protein